MLEASLQLCYRCGFLLHLSPFSYSWILSFIFRWLPGRRTARNRSSFHSPLWWSRLARTRCSHKSEGGEMQLRKTFPSGKHKHAWSFVKNKSKSVITHISNNGVKANSITAYLFLSPPPPLLPGSLVRKWNAEKCGKILFPAGFYLHWGSLF